MTYFQKIAINKINTRGAKNFNLAEIIPFEPESLNLMQGSSKFDPDERAIAVGIKVITESIVKLNNEKINTIGK